jgi:hypothetical protein
MKINWKCKVGCFALQLFFSVAAAEPLQEVEHAPTVVQCQADQALWSATLERGQSANSDVTFRSLLAWHKEMDKCQVVDSANVEKYYTTVHLATAAMLLRQYHFLERHSLVDQFYAEDDAGKR